jgi:ABC-type sugar transport system substrate-binding protein
VWKLGHHFRADEYGPKTAQGLLEGTVDLVIDSPAKDIAAKTVRAMARALDGRPLAAADLTSEFRLITPENC